MNLVQVVDVTVPQLPPSPLKERQSPVLGGEGVSVVGGRVKFSPFPPLNNEGLGWKGWSTKTNHDAENTFISPALLQGNTPGS